jgi:hypothetical protein
MNLPTAQVTKLSPASAIECLLSRMIDYAGLFPPASLEMRAAVTNYLAYSRSEYNWILGRLVVSAARLAELEETVVALPAQNGMAQLELSVLLGPDPSADAERIRQFNSRHATLNPQIRTSIESVEAKVSNADEALRLHSFFPQETELYLEFPLSSRLHDLVEAVKGFRPRLKIRTGGETADKIPTPEAVVEFLRFCVSADLPFKATAGLHHAVRSVHRLTYEPDSPSAMMHGFLNMFMGAAFLRGGMDAALALDLIKEELSSAFRFDAEGVWWREHRISARDLFRARRDFAISFGSCSFTEPIDDLRSLHLL